MRFLILLLLLSISFSVYADFLDHTVEYRYCGSPERYANGSIKRSTAVLNAFVKIHPCPATGLKTTSCEGWQINHTIPLACGGCDAVSNLDWIPTDTKTCSGDHCRDRYERNIYAADPPYPNTSNCVNKIVK